MNEIKRFDIVGMEEVYAPDGEACWYEDVAPILQRNKELETLLSKAQQVLLTKTAMIKELDADLAHFVASEQSAVTQLYDALKELAQLREQEPYGWKHQYRKILGGSEYVMLTVDNEPPYPDVNYLCVASSPLYAEPKPAQIPAALIEWANLSEYYELTQWHKGYEAARRLVKMQLDTMKGKS